MSLDQWRCWTITGCQKQDVCLAGKQLDKECWEIVQGTEDFRSSMHVCEDCIVYLSKAKKSVLSEDEIAAIMKSKGICVLVTKCVDDVLEEKGSSTLEAQKEKA